MRYFPLILIIVISISCGQVLTAPNKISAGLALSFDDDYIEGWYSLKDLFNRYHAKVTFFISYPHSLTNQEITMLKKLQADGHEIGCHGYSHNHALEYADMQDYIQTDIMPCIESLQAHGFNIRSFAYPWGQNSEETDNALLAYFDTIRDATVHDTACQWDNAYKYNNSIYWQGTRLICARGIDGAGGEERIFDELDTAKETGTILSLFTHKPSNESGQNNTPISKIENVLQYASDIGLRFYTMSGFTDSQAHQLS